MVRGFSHFAFVVSDVERSAAWYRDVLGLEIVARQRQANAYTREFVGVPDAILEVAELAVPGGGDILLELVEYAHPRGRAADLRTEDVGNAHASFLVEDIDAEHVRMVALGVTFVTAPVRITEGVNRGGGICYLKDPDGLTLELFQPPGTHGVAPGTA
jgi:lactoylglutathione lyase